VDNQEFLDTIDDELVLSNILKKMPLDDVIQLCLRLYRHGKAWKVITNINNQSIDTMRDRFEYQLKRILQEYMN